MAEIAPPWERQPGEGKSAYAAFIAYRDLPAKSRSLATAARRLGRRGNKGPSERSLRRWESLSRRWQWALRASAWDCEVERQRRDAENQTRRDMADRHARQAMGLQQKLLERLHKLNPDELGPEDLVRWLDVAVKVERMSREEVAATSATDTSNPADGRALTHAILNDPTASKLACRLLERIANATTRNRRSKRKEGSRQRAVGSESPRVARRGVVGQGTPPEGRSSLREGGERQGPIPQEGPAGGFVG